MLKNTFFNRDAQTVAKDLLGKIIRRRYRNHWLCVQIIETEAYYLHEKASHASLGFTEKRKALFMPAGTIYMYYARGGDSFNISAKGKGNAVLIKSGIPLQNNADSLTLMQTLNPKKNGDPRDINYLCSGQTLLCKALFLRVPDWNQKNFTKQEFYIDDEGYSPPSIIETTRLGIPEGRDEHLPYRFIDNAYVNFCTKKPS